MKTYTSDLGGSVEARNEKSARRKLENEFGVGVGKVWVDVIAESVKELPDCDCGWSGEGTGNNGQFVNGDRCPRCGTQLW